MTQEAHEILECHDDVADFGCREAILFAELFEFVDVADCLQAVRLAKLVGLVGILDACCPRSEVEVVAKLFRQNEIMDNLIGRSLGRIEAQVLLSLECGLRQLQEVVLVILHAWARQYTLE